MFNISLSDKYRVSIDCTSEGTQNKYYKDGMWYKEDRLGGEAACEYLASLLLQCTNLPKDSYVVYDFEYVNGIPSCKSEDFLRDEDKQVSSKEFITLYRYFKMIEGKKLNEVINYMGNAKEQINFVISYFRKMCGLDLSEYLGNILAIDRIILNEDRHFNNLGLIKVKDGEYRPAPIFDNGKSFFTGNYSVQPYYSIEKNVRIPHMLPFRGSREEIQSILPASFSLDYGMCMQKINELKNSEEYNKIKKSWADLFPENILEYQLDKARKCIASL